jgi:hypothetical protein
MSAADRYREFHGKNPRRQTGQRFHIPKQLVLLGKAVAIEYETDKLNGGGDGRRAVYRHEFETPAIVCMDETAHNQLYVIGSKIKVTDAGIEN